MTFKQAAAKNKKEKKKENKGNAINLLYFEWMVDSGALCWVIALQTHAADIWNGGDSWSEVVDRFIEMSL